MANPTRGLPSTFEINVPEDAFDKPVDLNDYLEEQAIPRAVAKPLKQSVAVERSVPKAEAQKVLQMPRQQAPSQPFPAEEPEATFQQRKASRPVSRKQLNMNPETLQMVEELLDYIRRYSVQKDAKASEMFHGLVAALYDARDLVSLSDVQARGRWGTPTAHAFPIDLKNAFQKAIAEWHSRNSS